MTSYEKIEEARKTLASINTEELDDNELKVYCALSAALCDRAAELAASGGTLTDRIIEAKRAFGHAATKKLYEAGEALGKCQDALADALLDNAIVTSDAVQKHLSLRGAKREFARTKSMMSIEKSLINVKAKIDSMDRSIGRAKEACMNFEKKIGMKKTLISGALNAMRGKVQKMSEKCQEGINKCRAYEQEHTDAFVQRAQNYVGIMTKE